MLPTLCVGIASLNPCFNGRYSQSATQRVDKRHQRVVLILVLMEDTLRAKNPLETKNL